jgi:hypothetical protein
MPEEDFHPSNQVHFQAHEPPHSCGGGALQRSGKELNLIMRFSAGLERSQGFRWDETAGLAEELSFPKRTRGAKGDQP